MKKKGYAYSLFVLLIFTSVFIIVVTNMKSVSVMQDSSYERVTMTKASELGKNIEYMQSKGITCPVLQNALAGITQFKIGCTASAICVQSISGDYTYGDPSVCP